VVVESLYSWEEFKFLKKEFGESFKLLNIFTTKSLRYARLKERPFRPLTNDEACSRDYSEIEKLDKGGPIAFADFTVHNDSTLDDLNINLRKFL
jgi:dephospho-CoA kinase